MNLSLLLDLLSLDLLDLLRDLERRLLSLDLERCLLLERLLSRDLDLDLRLLSRERERERWRRW